MKVKCKNCGNEVEKCENCGVQLREEKIGCIKLDFKGDGKEIIIRHLCSGCTKKIYKV